MPYMRRAAFISKCDKYRYSLTRDWDAEKLLPGALWIMLNPSTADAEQDDPTIRKVIGFSQLLECGYASIVNLYAFRATKPSDLWKAIDPVGPYNDEYIEREISCPRARIICAWGAHAKKDRVNQVMEIIRDAGHRAFCFGKTKDGHPRHPLMLPYTAKLEEFNG